MGKTTLIAFVGNIQTSLPGHEQNIFTWLEAVVPPLLALFLKGQWLGNGTQLNALINQHWQIGKQILPIPTNCRTGRSFTPTQCRMHCGKPMSAAKKY
jgi:hypothetical protein